MAAPAVPAVTTPWHDYLTGELGFSVDGATYIETDQGYTGLESIKILVPKDISNLADTMKKKRAGTAIDVSQGAERGLLYTLGYVRGCVYTSRTFTLAECTQDAREEWGQFWDGRIAYKEPTEVPDCSHYSTNWVSAFEQLDEYFKTIVGECN